jgi:hypothetical protein
MADTDDDGEDHQALSERFLDLVVFLPTGIAVALAEELPRLAERGRERLGVQVGSARAVGRFAVHAGQRELRKRSGGLKRSIDTGPGARPDASGAPATATDRAPDATTTAPPRLRSIPRPPVAPTGAPASAPVAPAPQRTEAAPVAPTGNGPVRTASANVPEVSSLAIPGFDTLSASQVVQRLDGLSRSELVAVRAYETCGRGRRTILSRVDQLLDERS